MTMVAEMDRDELGIAIRDHVVFEGDLHGRVVSFGSLVVKVGPDELWLGIPEPDAALAEFRDNQPIRLTLPDGEGARTGRSVFHRVLAGDPPRIVAVARPHRFDVVQRRMHHRYEMMAPIRCRQVDPITKEPRGRSAVASTINVSVGGMLLRTAAAISVGSELDLILPLGGGDKISTTNRVVRVQLMPTPDVPGQPFVLEVATRFTRITAVDQEMLLRMAFAADRRQRLAGEAVGAFAS
jgi:hypothetical protein